MSDIELREQIVSIASRFQIFQCIECADAITEWMVIKNIRGKQIVLFTGSSEDPYGNIYHEVRRKNIATNGVHKGIAVELLGEELIFDNINHQGISREAWLNNLYCVIKETGRDFQITETDF